MTEPLYHYLAGRGLKAPPECLGTVIRYHPALRFDGATSPAMVCLYRDIVTDAPCGIHRTFLDPNGVKLGRKMLGRTAGAAIKLDDDADVLEGLTIGEGVETCLAARQLGFRPCWALGSAGAVAAFPVLPAIEALTILLEDDKNGANARAAAVCAERWMAAGREVLTVRPIAGGDVNDALRSAP